MKRSLAALIVTTVGLVMPLNAQPDKPVSPATPAFKPAQATQPEAKAKPKVYDENADAKKQIAEIIEVPVGTVKSRLQRGRRLLEEALAKLASSQALLQTTLSNLEQWAADLRNKRMATPR